VRKKTLRPSFIEHLLVEIGQGHSRVEHIGVEAGMAERAFGAKQNRSGFVHHILGGQSRKLRLLFVHQQNGAIGPHRAHQRRQIVDHLTEAFASVAQIAFARVLRLAFLLHKTGELRRPLGE